MKSVKFECEDHYEAEKLAGLMSVQKGNEVWVTGVVAVIGNEIVIRLKDKSSHAVVMKDRETVDRLNSFLLEVAEGNAKIHSSDVMGSMTEIILD
jgi:NADP-dependent 3-hydroxy acid dehydrogenase YdfG